ncbi:diguanylate cyclase domain-containing protein [Acidovorax sp.]|uniref:diguanylate cyclase domain-containing protein n=1 Tax=Acidovorax sp. TaxID=1872122 RepID=UPI003919F773
MQSMLRCAKLVLMAVRVRPFGLALALLLSAQAQAQTVPPAGLWSHQNDALVSLSSLVIVVVLALLGAGIAWYAVRTNRRLVRVLADSDRRAQREQVRSRILGLLAQDSPLPTLLHEMVRGVEAGNPEMLCSILLLDSQQQCLLTGAAPSLPDSFNAAIHGAAIGPARGSCGTAASTGERVVVQDIQTHPYWVDFRDLAAQAGLASCWSEPIRSPSGQVLGTFAIYHRWPQAPGESDIVLIEEMSKLAAIAIERARAQDALRVSEERHRLLADHASDVIWTIDLQGRCTYVSPSVEKLRGYTVAEVMAQTMGEALAPSSAALASNLLRAGIGAVKRGERFPEQRNELEHPCKNGGSVWTEVSTAGIYGANGEFVGILGVSRDISDRRRTEQRIEHMAQHDPLTDLPNRTLLEDRLRLAMAAAHREARMLAVMFLDLDQFKPVNDQHGHTVGDTLLKAVAERLLGVMRASDTVARIGGDEFVVLLPTVGAEHDALLVAEKIREALSRPFDLDGRVVQVSASVGVALYPMHGSGDAELRRNADSAMYVAKEAGSNRVCLYPDRVMNPAEFVQGLGGAS